MTICIAALGEEQASWEPVLKLVALDDWEKVFLVGPGIVKSQLTLKDTFDFIEVDESQPIDQLVSLIKQRIEGAIFGDVCVNLFSGKGSTHMAIIAAILKAGGGVRLVHFTTDLIEV